VFGSFSHLAKLFYYTLVPRISIRMAYLIIMFGSLEIKSD
jgi:hypothetical protein